ncbi:MAG: hypothetical protein KBD26_01655 [Candidatus Pacebacteria bacterium]|nr:hypothetical protein [Candidatus Paceibacterota bacterium]MBP9772516.1 hypothetical protein [Candidatus Paceibacterota bacterium]
MIINIIKIFIPTTIAFFLGIGMTPFLMRLFIKNRLWKRHARIDETINADKISPTFTAIHNTKEELATPRVGGSIIWLATLGTALIIFLISVFIPNEITEKLNFISRNQTLLLLFAMLIASLVGLTDDLLTIFAKPGTFANGFPRGYMISIVLSIGLIGGLWFYYKLGISSMAIPVFGILPLGMLFIPVFMAVIFAVFSSGVIDGIDGLAGGVVAIIFGAYSTIALLQNQIDIAVFCAVVTGAILSFLWFNIPPARFYMGETGMLGLTVTLTIVAFLTDTVLLLPVVAFPLFATALSSAIQIFSKKYFNKKVFKVAPLHHHFEALGWSRAKITMRYWVISIIFAIIGIVLSLL